MRKAIFWGILIVLLTVGLAVGPDLWAAPGQSLHRQTVPTRTPAPGPTEPPPATEPPPEPPTATPLPPLPTSTPRPPRPSPTTEASPTATPTALPSPTPSPTPVPPTPTATPVPPSPTATDTPAPPPATAAPVESARASSAGLSPLLIAGVGLIAVGLVLLLLFGRRRAQ